MRTFQNEAELEEALSRPTIGVLKTMHSVPGDIMVLGAGGKMGPTLARMLARACDQIADSRRIYAVSRFTGPSVFDDLTNGGVVAIRADLSDRDALR